MIVDLYEQRCNETSDIFEHLPYFVETVLELDAQKVIELGVRWGVSTVAWIHGLDRTGGHLWAVDVGANPGLPEEWPWTFIQGDDLAVVDELPDGVDVVFIDTSHHYHQTYAELTAYVPKVRSGGRVLLHDTELERPDGHVDGDPAFPVRAAVADYCDLHDLAWSNRPNCHGLATIEVT